MPLRRREDAPFLLTTTSSTLLFTFSKNLVAGGAIIRRISITNTDSSADDVYVYFVPVGASAGVRYLIYRGLVPAKTTIPIDGPWFGGSEWFVAGGTAALSNAINLWVTSAEAYMEGGGAG